MYVHILRTEKYFCFRKSVEIEAFDVGVIRDISFTTERVS